MLQRTSFMTIDRKTIKRVLKEIEVGDLVFCARAVQEHRMDHQTACRVETVRIDPTNSRAIFGNKKGNPDLYLYYRPPARTIGFMATLVRKGIRRGLSRVKRVSTDLFSLGGGH